MLQKPLNDNCYDYLFKCTEKYGDFDMTQHLDKRFRRSEMKRDIEAFAVYAQKQLGLKAGDVYTIFMPTTIQAIVAFYALNKIGVIVNFVHPLLPAQVLSETMRDVGSKGVMVLDILSRKYIAAINETCLECVVCRSSDYASTLKGTALRAPERLVRAVFPKLRRRVEYADVMKTYVGMTAEPAGSGEDVAVYLNGGGTTGKSKTIKLTSKALNELCCSVSNLDEIHEPGEEAEIVVLPLFHCFGLTIAMHMALCNAARIIPMMQFDARLFNSLMRKNRVVGFGGIPVMFRKLMNEKHFDGEHLKNVRLMFCGGDDASDAFLQEFNSYFEKWGATGRLRQGYGLTEIGSVCCTNTNTIFREGSIGKAIDGVTVEIWDENKKPVPNGEIGEFAVSGPTIMSGYYTPGGGEDDGLYIDENGVKWVLSGDLGKRDDDGFFYFCGRKKRVVILSGYNIYPSDIEKKLSDLDFIKDVCLVKGYSSGKQILRCYVSFKKSGDTEDCKRRILECCEQNFSKFSVPREIVVLNELPQTPLMKIDFMRLTQDKPEDPEYKSFID